MLISTSINIGVCKSSHCPFVTPISWRDWWAHLWGVASSALEGMLAFGTHPNVFLWTQAVLYWRGLSIEGQNLCTSASKERNYIQIAQLLSVRRYIFSFAFWHLLTAVQDRWTLTAEQRSVNANQFAYNYFDITSRLGNALVWKGNTNWILVNCAYDINQIHQLLQRCLILYKIWLMGRHFMLSCSCCGLMMSRATSQSSITSTSTFIAVMLAFLADYSSRNILWTLSTTLHTWYHIVILTLIPSAVLKQTHSQTAMWLSMYLVYELIILNSQRRPPILVAKATINAGNAKSEVPMRKLNQTKGTMFVTVWKVEFLNMRCWFWPDWSYMFCWRDL